MFLEGGVKVFLETIWVTKCFIGTIKATFNTSNISKLPKNPEIQHNFFCRDFWIISHLIMSNCII